MYTRNFITNSSCDKTKQASRRSSEISRQQVQEPSVLVRDKGAGVVVAAREREIINVSSSDETKKKWLVAQKDEVDSSSHIKSKEGEIVLGTTDDGLQKEEQLQQDEDGTPRYIGIIRDFEDVRETEIRQKQKMMAAGRIRLLQQGPRDDGQQ